MWFCPGMLERLPAEVITVCVPHLLFIIVVYLFSINEWHIDHRTRLDFCHSTCSEAGTKHHSLFWMCPRTSHFNMGFIRCWEWSMTGAVLNTISMRGQHLTACGQTEMLQSLLIVLPWNLSGWCPRMNPNAYLQESRTSNFVHLLFLC